MPHYVDHVQATDRGYGLQIIRTPQTKPLIAVVTSLNLLGCKTHFWKGRTLPCESPNCEACLSGQPWVWHYYMAVWLPATADHCLYETTPQAADSFEAYRAKYGTLRGCRFRATRQGNARNGRIKIETYPADLSKLPLPNAPDLQAILAVLWSLPTRSLSTARPRYAGPELSVSSDVTGLARDDVTDKRRAEIVAGLEAITAAQKRNGDA